MPRHTRDDLPPVLLTDATWFGTLAAARDLGSRGVRVTLAADRLAAPARFSRHVHRTIACPPTSHPERFGAWLRDFARREPGHVYYPTSDDAAWVASAHREALQRDLSLYSPPIQAIVALVDKSQLQERALAAGLSAPETWLPRDEAELLALADALPYPVIAKPRTHVLSAGWARAAMARNRGELREAWAAMRRDNRLAPAVVAQVPDVELPLLQAVRPGSERIYTVDGFITEGGELFAALACVKTLQSPRGSGAGIVFEDAPLDPSTASGLRRLLSECGYHGVFDAEFLYDGDRLLLIDVNPRFYNHMAFEIDRGMPLSWWAYLAARGDRDGLRAAMEAQRPPEPGRVYVHGLRTRLLLATQRLSGAMSGREVARWRAWIREHGDRLTDPSTANGDRAPLLAEVALEAQRALAHPRSYVRNHLRGAPGPAAPARTGG